MILYIKPSFLDVFIVEFEYNNLNKLYENIK